MLGWPWRFWRHRLAGKPDGAQRPAVGNRRLGWTRLRPMQPTASFTAPVTIDLRNEPSALQSSWQSRPRGTMTHLSTLSAPPGRVSGMVTVITAVDLAPPPWDQITTAVDRVLLRRPVRRAPTSQRQSAGRQPLTEAAEPYVGQPQVPAEPYRAPARPSEPAAVGAEQVAAEHGADLVDPLGLVALGMAEVDGAEPAGSWDLEQEQEPQRPPVLRRATLAESRRLGFDMRGPLPVAGEDSREDHRPLASQAAHTEDRTAGEPVEPSSAAGDGGDVGQDSSPPVTVRPLPSETPSETEPSPPAGVDWRPGSMKPDDGALSELGASESVEVDGSSTVLAPAGAHDVTASSASPTHGDTGSYGDPGTRVEIDVRDDTESRGDTGIRGDVNSHNDTGIRSDTRIRGDIESRDDTDIRGGIESRGDTDIRGDIASPGDIDVRDNTESRGDADVRSGIESHGDIDIRGGVESGDIGIRGGIEYRGDTDVRDETDSRDGTGIRGDTEPRGDTETPADIDTHVADAGPAQPAKLTWSDPEPANDQPAAPAEAIGPELPLVHIQPHRSIVDTGLLAPVQAPVADVKPVDYDLPPEDGIEAEPAYEVASGAPAATDSDAMVAEPSTVDGTTPAVEPAQPDLQEATPRPPRTPSQQVPAAAPTRSMITAQPGSVGRHEPHFAREYRESGAVEVFGVPRAVADRLRSIHTVDFGDVAVYRGRAVSARARALRARSFTESGAIHLPDEVGRLEGAEAGALLAHELTHVAQQRTLGASLPAEDSIEGQELEAQAVAVEQWFACDGPPAGQPELEYPPLRHVTPAPAPPALEPEAWSSAAAVPIVVQRAPEPVSSAPAQPRTVASWSSDQELPAEIRLALGLDATGATTADLSPFGSMTEQPGQAPGQPQFEPADQLAFGLPGQPVDGLLGYGPPGEPAAGVPSTGLTPSPADGLAAALLGLAETGSDGRSSAPMAVEPGDRWAQDGSPNTVVEPFGGHGQSELPAGSLAAALQGLVDHSFDLREIVAPGTVAPNTAGTAGPEAAGLSVEELSERLSERFSDNPPKRWIDMDASADLEELAAKLYDRLHDRLRRDVLVQRERSGMLMDLR